MCIVVGDKIIPLTKPLCPAPPVAIRKATSELLELKPPVYISVGSTRASTPESARKVPAKSGNLLKVNMVEFWRYFESKCVAGMLKSTDFSGTFISIFHSKHYNNAISYFTNSTQAISSDATVPLC